MFTAVTTKHFKSLSNLECPKTLARVIRCFYQMHTRGIESSGCVARNLTRPTRSILQGCPFSVMLLSGIRTVWCQQMKLKVPRIQLGVFVGRSHNLD